VLHAAKVLIEAFFDTTRHHQWLLCVRNSLAFPKDDFRVLRSLVRHILNQGSQLLVAEAFVPSALCLLVDELHKRCRRI